MLSHYPRDRYILHAFALSVMHTKSAQHRAILGVTGWFSGLAATGTMTVAGSGFEPAAVLVGTMWFSVYSGFQYSRHVNTANAYDKIYKDTTPSKDEVSSKEAVFQEMVRLELIGPSILPWVNWSVWSKLRSRHLDSGLHNRY
jgi:hypothetical protein